MGKGDKRTRRGKIRRGTYGNSRLKRRKKRRQVAAQSSGREPPAKAG